jgi:peptidoglycan/xylan/chitin deacetylase (PgdA/CDA1 family)
MSVEEIQFGRPGTHPLLSVIAPAYNAEPFLLTALASAQAQTHRDLESGRVLGERESHRRLNWDEVAQLSRHKLAEIGAHTVTHPKLSAFSRARQEFEITRSKADLEERIGRPVASFAYPYASAAHINQLSVELMQQAGFLRACASRKALVREEESCFAWPRIHVSNLDGNEFEELLTAAFSQC